MTSPGTYRRVLRRETHSSRSRMAIVLAVLLIVVAAWVGTESVLGALGQPALLVAPEDGVAAVLGATSAPVALITAAAAVVAVVGLILVVVSLAPGRRNRRGAVADRTASVVDDKVIAQSLAQTASYAGDVAPDQVSVSVGRRSVDVLVTRTSGRAADVGTMQRAVDAELNSYDFGPALRGRVRLTDSGKVA